MITIKGKKSQLAQCLVQKIKCPIDIISSDEIDLRDYKNIELVLKRFSNKIIINCFAFNDVEEAESNRDAYKINQNLHDIYYLNNSLNQISKDLEKLKSDKKILFIYDKEI